VAVRRLPDSGLVVRLTRGRAWIGVLSVLLTGIVALNVISLSLNASQGRIAQQAQILEQENSVLRARLAQRLSSERVRNAAASLGMTAPEPADVTYRDSSGDSVRLAARRLADGFDLGASLVVAPATTTTYPTETATPVAAETTAPAVTTTPVTTVSATAEPATSTSTVAGGVAPG
jgi:hypothetical protein